MLGKKMSHRIVGILCLMALSGCGSYSRNDVIEVEGWLATDMVISGKTMEEHLFLFSPDVSYYLTFEPDCKFIGTEEQKGKEKVLYYYNQENKLTYFKDEIHLYIGKKYRIRGKIRPFKIKPPDSDFAFRISSDELEKLRKNAKEVVVSYMEYIRPE